MMNKCLTTGKIILVMLLLLCPALSHTDEAAQRPRQVRLTWTGDEYVLRYEIVVEKEENERYIQLHRIFTEASFLELSLLPGTYRYSVVPYDLLNQPGRRTEWKIVEIPAVEDTVIIDDESVDELIDPVKPFEIIFFFLKPSLAIFIPIYGELIDDFIYAIPTPGPKLAFDMISPISRYFSAGMELAASWFYLNNLFKDYSFATHMVTLELNVLLQLQFFNRRVSVSLRFGTGLTMLADRLADHQEETVNPDPLTGQINAGVSFLWLIKDSSYIETGIDFSHIFGWDAGCLRPWIGFGIRL